MRNFRHAAPVVFTSRDNPPATTSPFKSWPTFSPYDARHIQDAPKDIYFAEHGIAGGLKPMGNAFSELSPAAFFSLYGELLYLLFHAPLQRSYDVEDIERRFITPMSRNQFRVYRRQTGPVALLTWALLSDDLHKRMFREPFDLAPEDWDSGPHVWYPDFIAPFGHAAQVIDDMLTHVFHDRVSWAQRVTKPSERGFMVKKYVGRSLRADDRRRNSRQKSGDAA